MRVLIGDTSPSIRERFRELLEEGSCEAVSSAAATGDDDLEREIARYRPDAVLLSAARVLALLQRAASGVPRLSLELSGKLARALAGVGVEATVDEPLTGRERQVLELMARGITSNRQLASRLRVSQNTVKFHVRNILDKLRLHDRAQAVGYALRVRAARDGAAPRSERQLEVQADDVGGVAAVD